MKKIYDDTMIVPAFSLNAHGMGIKNMAPALYQNGSWIFFVADFDEAMAAKSNMGRADIEIYTLDGFQENQTKLEDGIYPVLRTREDWNNYERALRMSYVDQRKAIVQLQAASNYKGFDEGGCFHISAEMQDTRIDVVMYAAHCDMSKDGAYQQKQIEQLEEYMDIMVERHIHIMPQPTHAPSSCAHGFQRKDRIHNYNLS